MPLLRCAFVLRATFPDFYLFILPSIHQAIYGGRVDNDFDARVLRAYLLQFFSPEVLAGRVDFGGVQAPKVRRGRGAGETCPDPVPI